MAADQGDRAAALARDYAAHVTPSLLPIAATVLALAGIREGDTVADVGCGAGLLTHPAAAAAGPDGRVYGIDCDAALLALARARRPSAVAWVRADAGRLPFPARSVDKVLSGSVLHRLPDVRPALAEWARVLAPGGRVAASAWGEFTASPHEDALLDALAVNGVDRSASERRIALAAAGAARRGDELPHLLCEAGLRVTYETGGEITLPFAGTEPYARWRLSFPRVAAALAARRDADAVRADVVARVGEALGGAPVLVHSNIHYVTATARG